MTKEKLQEKIDREEKSAKEMREIGEAYLRGDVLRDPVAAEGWLMKVIEAEDSWESPVAMALIATKILKEDQILSDEDYQEIHRELEKAEGEKKAELEHLLSFAADWQKGV